MIGADIGVGWVDTDGSVHFQDRFAVGQTRPMFDNTTIDWFAEQGREENGWTAIRFKRLLNTCDSMDVPIKVIQITSRRACSINAFNIVWNEHRDICLRSRRS